MIRRKDLKIRVLPRARRLTGIKSVELNRSQNMVEFAILILWLTVACNSYPKLRDDSKCHHRPLKCSVNTFKPALQAHKGVSVLFSLTPPFCVLSARVLHRVSLVEVNPRERETHRGDSGRYANMTSWSAQRHTQVIPSTSILR